jgi:hypothetical protein
LKKQISIRGETKERAKVEAERQGMSLSEFVDHLCCRYLDSRCIQPMPAGPTVLERPLDPATIPSKIRGVD